MVNRQWATASSERHRHSSNYQCKLCKNLSEGPALCFLVCGGLGAPIPPCSQRVFGADLQHNSAMADSPEPALSGQQRCTKPCRTAAASSPHVSHSSCTTPPRPAALPAFHSPSNIRGQIDLPHSARSRLQFHHQ